MATGKRDIAYVADAIVVVLKANLPTKLDALDVEYADGLVLEDTLDQSYFISEKLNITQYPVICVVPDRTEIPSDGQYRYNIEYHHLTIMLALAARGQIEEELKRRTMRTLRGIEEVLLSYFTLDGAVADLICSAKQYAPMISEGNALLQEGQLTIRVMINA